MTKSELFHLSPESWLGMQLDSGQQEVISPKKALACECKSNKGDAVPSVLKASLEQEMVAIKKLPEVGFALRCDKIEEKRAKDAREQQLPSVDACIRAGGVLMLVECKYKALPETSIVKTIKEFESKVVRKFEASELFYRHEGVNSFLPDRIVLFNADSKDKVINMFRRLQLETGGSLLRRYKIMDTADFWMNYESVICCDLD